MLLEDRRGGAVHVPADQHVDGLGDLRRNTPPPPAFHISHLCPAEAASNATGVRAAYRPDADALGEAVVGLDVLVELLDGSPSQRRAVVGLVDVEHHCKKPEESQESHPTLDICPEEECFHILLPGWSFRVCGRGQFTTCSDKFSNLEGLVFSSSG